MRFTTKILATLVCLSLGFGGIASQASTNNTKRESRGGALREMMDTRGTRKLIDDAIYKSQAQDLVGACSDIRAAFGSRDFATLDDHYLASSYILLAGCEADEGAYDKAWADFVNFEKYMPKEFYSAELTEMKISLAEYSEHKREALEAFIYLATKSPEKVLKYDMRDITRLNGYAEDIDDNRVLQQKFLETLRNIHYKDPKGLASAAYYWFDLFEIYVAQGKTEAAQALVPEFDTPNLVIRLRSDKRYRGFTEAGPDLFDYQKVFEKDMERDRLIMEAHPTLLEPIVTYVGDLISQGKNEQALCIIEDAIQKAKASPADKPAYEDQNEQLQWALSYKSSLTWYKGDVKQALEIKILARDDALKNSSDKVSLVLNLADDYCAAEQPLKALDVLKNFDENNASAYGKVTFKAVRLCAYVQTGDNGHAKEDLDYILTHQDDAIQHYGAAYLLVNDQANLAKSIIAHLEEPKTRNETLLIVQTYRHDNFETPYQLTIRKRFEAVLARSDVKAAIAKYGYVDTYIAH